MELFDQATLDGNLKLKVYRVDPHQGKILINTFDESNLITTSGLKLITYLLAGETGNNKVIKVGVGEGSLPAHASDVGLTNVYIKNIDSYSYLRNNVIEYTISMDTGDANGLNISEFGLFSGDDVLFSRRLQIPTIPKESDIIIEGVWSVSIFQCKEWEFSASTEIKHIINSEISAIDVDQIPTPRYFSSLPSSVHDISSNIVLGDLDDFTGINGNPPDIGRWTAQTWVDGKCEIQNNRLRMYSNTYGGLAQLDYNAGFNHNFDAQILFEHISSGSNIPIYWQITVTNQISGNIVRFNNGNNPSDSYNDYIFIEQYNGSWSTPYIDTAIYQSGKVRFVRNGTSLETWAANGANPTTLRNTMAAFGTGACDYKIYFPNTINSNINTWDFDDFSLNL